MGASSSAFNSFSYLWASRLAFSRSNGEIPHNTWRRAQGETDRLVCGKKLDVLLIVSHSKLTPPLPLPKKTEKHLFFAGHDCNGVIHAPLGKSESGRSCRPVS